MKFIVDKASWNYWKGREKEIWTLEELIEYVKEVWAVVIWGEEEKEVEKYRGDKLSCNKYKVKEKTWRISLTIYDDYLE
jgi:hypothetical protein